MFNVECSPNTDRGESACSIPLWRFRSRKCKRVRPLQEDNLREGVSIHPPGSRGRVADLVAFYAANGNAEISAFTV